MVTRRQHRTQTLLRLNAAAVASIEEHGPDVTLEVIADRADVSRRTVYRWARGRDDLVFVHPWLWLEVFDEAAVGAADEPVATRIRRAAAAVCDLIDADPEPVARSMRVALEHPQLLRGYSDVNQAWIERLAAEVRSSDEEVSSFRARAIGAAIMGMIDAALAEWVTARPSRTMSDLIGEGFDHLQPLLDEI